MKTNELTFGKFVIINKQHQFWTKNDVWKDGCFDVKLFNNKKSVFDELKSKNLDGYAMYTIPN